MRENSSHKFPETSSGSGESGNLQSEIGDHAFKELVQALPVAIYTCNRDGYITFFNDAAALLWGRQPQTGQDKWYTFQKFYHPYGNLMQIDDDPVTRVLNTGKPITGEEITIERSDGSFLNLLAFSRPFFDNQHTVTGVHNTLVDITSKKQDEEKKAVLSAIVASSDDAIISKSLEGMITSWNAGAQKIFGYTEQEVLGKHISIIIPTSLLDEENTIISKIRSGQKIDHFQTTRISKFGREIPISITVSPVKDSQGHIIGASKIARDISERLLIERAVQQNTQNLRILNAIGKIISEKLDVQAILQQVTDATTKITGAAFGAFFYNTIDERGEAFMLFSLSGAPREAFEKFGMPRNTAVFDPTFSGKGVVRVDDITKDPRYGHNAPHHGMPKGHLPVVSYLAVPVISSSGTVIGGLFFGHPEAGVFTLEHEAIVDSIASQAAVALDNSKLFEEVKALSAKKDEFIALASHELKTPLTTIKGYLQILERNEKNDLAKTFIGKISNQVEKLNTLITDLFDVSKIEAGKLQLYKETFNLKELLNEIIETFHYTNKTHQLVFQNNGGPLLVEADRQRIEQVIINLLTNAIKYSPKSNQVLITAEGSASTVTVKVKDEGIGLSPDQQKKIFSRFYRAEGSANVSGLGLGLYLTKEIIDRHHGKIGVNSALGKGSTFFFSLPLK